MDDNELRLAIAKVKGWKYFISNKNNLPIRGIWINKSYSEPDAEFWDEAEFHYSVPPFTEEIPDWPADISAAWELVEELIADGSLFAMSWKPQLDSWAVQVFRNDSSILGTPAPRAICLAYLAWKEGAK